MKNLLTILLMLWTAGYTSGQRIATQPAIADLEFLNEAVIHGHPVNYNPRKTVTIDHVVHQARVMDKDSLSVAEFRRLLHESLDAVGCVHTSIRKNPFANTAADRKYFPWKLTFENGKMVDSLHREIQAINSIPVDTLVQYFAHYHAADGGTNSFANTYFHYYASSLLAAYFNYPEKYQVETGGRTETLDAVPAPLSGKNPAIPTAGVLLRNNQNALYLYQNYPVLKVTDFNKSDIRFFRRALRYLRENSYEHLVLDLRGNTGGNRRSAIALTRNLVGRDFQYSILQPKLRPAKYLNRKGKFYLFVSRIKYNGTHFFRGRRTGLGREFTYRYRAARRPFRGQLYVLTDGFTASASTMVTSWIKQYTNAVFVGTQAGGGYNGNNGGSFPLLTLPHTGFQIRFPVYRLILDRNSDHSEGIVPDVAVEPTFGEDLPLNKTILYIKDRAQ